VNARSIETCKIPRLLGLQGERRPSSVRREDLPGRQHRHTIQPHVARDRRPRGIPCHRNRHLGQVAHLSAKVRLCIPYPQPARRGPRGSIRHHLDARDRQPSPRSQRIIPNPNAPLVRRLVARARRDPIEVRNQHTRQLRTRPGRNGGRRRQAILVNHRIPLELGQHRIGSHLGQETSLRRLTKPTRIRYPQLRSPGGKHPNSGQHPEHKNHNQYRRPTARTTPHRSPHTTLTTAFTPPTIPATTARGHTHKDTNPARTRPKNHPTPNAPRADQYTVQYTIPLAIDTNVTIYPTQYTIPTRPCTPSVRRHSPEIRDIYRHTRRTPQ